MTLLPLSDPERARVLPNAAPLPAVGDERLTAAALRQRFAQPPIWTPENLADSARLNERAPRAAAVLLPLVPRAAGLQLILTRRHAGLHEHPGQISFPGGRRDSQDVHPAVTALREAQEEIGLAPQGLEVLGSLPPYLTASRYLVVPVVALVPPHHHLQPQPGEVSEVFEVPLGFLMNPLHHQHRVWEPAPAAPGTAAMRREFLSMPYERGGQRYFIWGATAAMIRNLYRLLIA